MEYKIGDVIKSNAGRDKGTYYIVTACEDAYVLAANGKTRAIDYPKRKKKKHILFVARIDETAAEILGKRTGAFSLASKTGDSELRKLLKALGYGNSKEL